MPYVPVPKDLSSVKNKVAMNLTGRQLVCFGSGILAGVPLFFICSRYFNASAASMLMIGVMLPFFLLAMYERQGLPLEKVLLNILRVYFLRPKVRPYRTMNFYTAVERQAALDKEVYEIVKGKTTDPGPAKKH